MRKRAAPMIDLLRLVERIIRHAEDAGERDVVVRTALVRQLFEYAKRAPNPTRGRQREDGRERIRRRLEIVFARRRKTELIAAGLSRGEAEQLAAEEAQRKLSDLNLSSSTIRRWMQTRPRC